MKGLKYLAAVVLLLFVFVAAVSPGWRVFLPGATRLVEVTPTRTRAPTKTTDQNRTSVPAVPTTVFPYVYHSVFQSCEYARDTYVQGRVYADKNDPNSWLSGVKMRLSSAPDGEPVADVISDRAYTVLLCGNCAKSGTFYVWVVRGNLRVSELSSPINFSRLGPSGGCQAATVDFWKEPGR